MQKWHFWAIMAMLFVINSNVVDRPFSDLISFISAMVCGFIAGSAYMGEK